MIVVDTNVISYFYLSSPYSVLADQLFTRNPCWSAPVLWRSEFRNVVAFYVREKILSLQDGIQMFESAESLLETNEYQVNSAQVLKLSHESGCSAYDCEFVGLARDLNVPLVTMDKKILKSFRGTAVSIQAYLKEW
jgi:predicted nucleic acid-binding protein